MLLIVAALTTLFSTSLTHPLVSRQTTITCPTGIHVIGASGDNLPSGPQDWGLLSNLSTSILNSIAGSTSISIPFDKYSTNHLTSTTAGSTTLIQYLDQFHASCPCTKVAVIGYSAGAIIAMNALCGASTPWTSPATGLNSSYADYIVATVVYGDSTRYAAAPYNLGTCTGNGNTTRTAATAACPIFAQNLQSYCDVGDPVCCQGDDTAVHFVYDEEYDGQSSQFVVEKYNSAAPVCSTSATSTSAIAAPTTSSSSTSTTAAPTTSSASTTATPTTSSTTTTVAPIPSTSTTGAPTTTLSTTTPLPTTTSTPATTSPVPATSNTAPASTSTSCPTNVSGQFEFPHLILPISSTSPTTAFGTSYNGQINSTTSTIFNFDIPSTYTGLTCTVFFSLPLASALQYSSYSTSGNPVGGASFSLLSGVASAATSYSNAPSVQTSLGAFDMTPGAAFVVASAPCESGQTLSYEMNSNDGYALEYFQDYASPPIGLYVSAC